MWCASTKDDVLAASTNRPDWSYSLTELSTRFGPCSTSRAWLVASIRQDSWRVTCSRLRPSALRANRWFATFERGAVLQDKKAMTMPIPMRRLVRPCSARGTEFWSECLRLGMLLTEVPHEAPAHRTRTRGWSASEPSGGARRRSGPIGDWTQRFWQEQFLGGCCADTLALADEARG